MPVPAVNDTAVVNEGASVVIDLSGNDTDPDNALDLASIAITSGPTNGSLVDNGNGTLTYTPGAGFSGIDSFTYEARDALAGSQAATVSIEVTPVIAGTYTYTMDQQVAIADNGFIVSTIEVTDSYTLLDINVELNITH